MLHLVEQRVRRDLRAPVEFRDRHLTFTTLYGSIYKHRIMLCGYNVLSDRVLLVVIPWHPNDISHALFNASYSLFRRFNEIHHQVAPFWQGRYSSCPFADEVAWPVLRYVDRASERDDVCDPFDPCALNSAAEHAGIRSCAMLTATPERLPHPELWHRFLGAPEEERFVQALELCLRTGKPFGPFQFVRKVEQACGRRVRSVCLKWPGLFGDGHDAYHDRLRPARNAGPLSTRRPTASSVGRALRGAPRQMRREHD
jgi:hypothetical protein